MDLHQVDVMRARIAALEAQVEEMRAKMNAAIALRDKIDSEYWSARVALESQVKALTEERDGLQDAVDFLNTMNDELDEWFTRIADDHGGWHEDLPTGEAHIEEIIGNLKKERDAQAEAVRVLGEYVHAVECVDSFSRTREKLEALEANPIARAAVEGGIK